MVISSKTSTEIYIPLVIGGGSGLTLTSEINHTNIEFDATPSVAGNYYLFNIDLSDVPDGEYIYTVGQDKGIIRIGTYKCATVSYTSDNKNIQYQYK